MDIGGNSAAALRSYVERFENLEKDEERLKEEKKSRFDNLSQKGLPVAGIKKIMADRKKEPEKLEEQRQALVEAGALLGVTVYVGEIEDDGTNPFDDGDKAFAEQEIKAILGLEADLEGVKQDKKELLKEAKSDGFAPKIIVEVVKIRKDPESWNEHSLLVKTYLNAVDSAIAPNNVAPSQTSP